MRNVGGLHCWTVKGEAQVLFRQIQGGIGQLFTAHMDTIGECQLSREELGWSVYTIGENVEHAVPMLLIDCVDAETRATTVSIIKKSDLW